MSPSRTQARVLPVLGSAFTDVEFAASPSTDRVRGTSIPLDLLTRTRTAWRTGSPTIPMTVLSSLRGLCCG
ncbi:hypothetical protein [Streptomyces scabiei]|uniref:Uncharacterized protein n=1 Tax=Streptomyces scabiei TaxID=1930 RepID=A0A100JW63_STRSC|nr:hypothetical protein [Streptomyces scabiei]GAQ66805.1 hypothetical protein SsS58_07244 [Streptomyces scabiei]